MFVVGFGDTTKKEGLKAKIVALVVVCEERNVGEKRKRNTTNVSPLQGKMNHVQWSWLRGQNKKVAICSQQTSEAWHND